MTKPFGSIPADAVPYLTKIMIDEAIPNKDLGKLGILAVILAALIVLYEFGLRYRTVAITRVGQLMLKDMRRDIFTHIQTLPFSYFDSRPHGKILIRVVNYVNSVSDMLSNGLINIVLESFNLLFIVIFMFLVDVQMAFVVLCGVPVLCVFMVWIKNKQRRAWQAVSNKNSNLNAYLQENIVGARITQIFAREDENAEIFKDLSKPFVFFAAKKQSIFGQIYAPLPFFFPPRILSEAVSLFYSIVAWIAAVWDEICMLCL